MNTFINNRVVHNILFAVAEPFVVEFYERNIAFILPFVNSINPTLEFSSSPTRQEFSAFAIM
jgi:hypothetical protein